MESNYWLEMRAEIDYFANYGHQYDIASIDVSCWEYERCEYMFHRYCMARSPFGGSHFFHAIKNAVLIQSQRAVRIFPQNPMLWTNEYIMRNK